MALVTGELTFIVKKVGTDEEEYVTADAVDFEVDSTQTDTEDDKQRESVHMVYYGAAFDGTATFIARPYFDVFGANVFRYSLQFEDVSKGYAVDVDESDPDEGLCVEASPLKTEEDVG